MTAGAQVPILLVKEARALLPIWMACAAIGSAAAFMDGTARDLAGGAFGAGMIALGAYAIGQEYLHRTLGALLVQPIDRRRVLLVKLGVAAAMVLPLAGYASVLHLFSPEIPPWLVAAIALGLAPAVTMLFRNAVAGTMFSIWIAMILLIVVVLIVGGWTPPADAEREAHGVWRQGMVVLCAGGAVLGWRLFSRLEWLDAELVFSMPWTLHRSRDVAPAPPIWQLLKKEIRLQRMAFGLSALYLAAFAAEGLVRFLRPEANLPVLAAATMGYWLCLPVLIGATASAEERHLGTRASQLLLPVPAWHQWAVKAGTVFGLSFALAIVVPALALQVLGSGDVVVRALPDGRTAILLVFVLSAASLYVSSLSSTAGWAGAVSLSALAACYALAGILARGAIFPRPSTLTRPPDAAHALLVLAGVLLVRFAFVNHRSEVPLTPRAWRETIWLGALAVVAIALIESRPF